MYGMYIIITAVLMTAVWLWKILLTVVEYRSTANKLPANVSDIYDENEFKKWQSYDKEHCKLNIISETVAYALDMALAFSGAFTLIPHWFGENVYTSAILTVIFYLILSEIVSIPFSYISKFKIEQKYGFNKSTIKTFIADIIKEFIISALLMCGLLALYILLHSLLGNYIILVFAGILIVLVLFISFIYPLFSRIFNKFKPLEEGELKDKLTALLNKYGYKVKAIEVMDASRRTTKSNAYFSGFGKTKSIVLYDNLVEAMTTDEICAVFAHEMGHGLHKDTLKSSVFSFLNMAVLALMAWFISSTPDIYGEFGFWYVNYGFGFFLLMSAGAAFVQPLLSFFANLVSRKAEYRADAQAAKDGYGDALVSALKKLSKENFSNLAPSKLLVTLQYSHPTTSQRIEALEKLK